MLSYHIDGCYMVTFNKVLSGSVVHVPEQTHTNNVISIIFGINTLYIHVIHLWPDALPLGG